LKGAQKGCLPPILGQGLIIEVKKILTNIFLGGTEMKKMIMLSGIVMVLGQISGVVMAQQWIQKGLAGKKIACMTLDDSGRIIAGTTEIIVAGVRDDRLQVGTDKSNTAYAVIPSSLAMDLKAIARSNSGKFGMQQFLGVGLEWNNNVSTNRGFILNGQSSSPFYSTSSTSTLLGVSALAVRVTSSPTKDTVAVFECNGSKIGYGLLKYGSVTLDTIKKIPANVFGAVKPFCTAMSIFGKDRKCYAGGYDTSGTGSGNLIREIATDSMEILKSNIKVTALFAGSKYLYVGTKDDGLYRYEEPATAGASGTWTHASAPANEAIRSIVAISTSATDDIVYCAVASGVYKSLSSASIAWNKLGTLSSAPICLTLGLTMGEIYAGTISGVFMFPDVVSIKQAHQSQNIGGLGKLSYRTTTTSLDFTISSKVTSKVSIGLYSLSGKLLAVKAGSAGRISFEKQHEPVCFVAKSNKMIIGSGTAMVH
jgi:hypothetical protein